MKPFLKQTCASLLAMALLGTVVSVQAEDHNPKTDAPAAPAKSKRDSLPFHGKLAAVDKSAMTITLEGKESQRVFQVTPSTKIIKTGKPASLDDAVVGEDVGGAYRKNEQGKMEALSLRLGAKPEKAEKKVKGEKKAEQKNPENKAE